MGIKSKLRSRRGESLGEVMVGLLIGALALTMLAGCIATCARIVLTSSSRMSEYYGRNNLLEQRMFDEDEGVTRQSGRVNIQLDGVDLAQPVDVYYYIHTQGDVDIVSYGERP